MPRSTSSRSHIGRESSDCVRLVAQCGCMTQRMGMILKTGCRYPLSTLSWCTEILTTVYQRQKTTTGASHSGDTKNHQGVCVCVCMFYIYTVGVFALLSRQPDSCWLAGFVAVSEIRVRAVRPEMDVAAVKRASCAFKGRIKDRAAAMITSVQIAAVHPGSDCSLTVKKRWMSAHCCRCSIGPNREEVWFRLAPAVVCCLVT